MKIKQNHPFGLVKEEKEYNLYTFYGLTLGEIMTIEQGLRDIKATNAVAYDVYVQVRKIIEDEGISVDERFPIDENYE